MPFDVIAVEIVSAAPEVPPALSAALLDACTRAAQSGRCVPASEASERGAAQTLAARVVWTEPHQVHIEVTAREPAAGSAPLTRDVTFAMADALEERYRAAGFLVGTLASVLAGEEGTVPTREAAFPGEETPKAAPSPAAPLPEAAEPAPAPAARTQAPRPPAPTENARAAWLEVGPVLANALSGSIRLGGSLDGRLRLTERVHASFGAAYSEGLTSPRNVTTRWVEGTLGVLVKHDVMGPLSAGLRVEGVALHLGASLDRDDASGTLGGSRFLGGVRAGATAHVWLTDTLGVLADGSAQWLGGTTEVRADGRHVGSAAALGYAVRAGVAVGLF